MPGRHHCSFAIEHDEKLYWFDAGECCSYTAYLAGIDPRKIHSIFISHPHMDHIGGLGNLLWNIRKFSTQYNILPHFDGVRVYCPNLQPLDGLLTLLQHTEGNYKTEYPTLFQKITDGIVLQNQDIQVEALHNQHLEKTSDGWQSFSFRILAEDKKIIYSGDIQSLDDLTDFLKEGCEALFIETGHHTAEEICQRIVERGYDVKSLYFLHHGRKILNDPDGVWQRCKEIFPSVHICNDKDEFFI
jgi:ribonuclease BN (tRNA processing enzyme)